MTAGPDYVFLCVPRAASVSISRNWLVQHYQGQELNVSYHAQVVPEEHCSKFTFASVRNPYDRMLSLWYLCHFGVRGVGTSEMHPTTTSAGFVDWCSTVHGDSRWLNQSQFLSLARVDAFVRYERLELDLAQLPFAHVWYPLVRVNDTERPAFQQDLSPEFIRAVNRHSAPDFAAYGYEQLCA
jgi:hypothetical protein